MTRHHDVCSAKRRCLLPGGCFSAGRFVICQRLWIYVSKLCLYRCCLICLAKCSMLLPKGLGHLLLGFLSGLRPSGSQTFQQFACREGEASQSMLPFPQGPPTCLFLPLQTVRRDVPGLKVSQENCWPMPNQNGCINCSFVCRTQRASGLSSSCGGTCPTEKTTQRSHPGKLQHEQSETEKESDLSSHEMSSLKVLCGDD